MTLGSLTFTIQFGGVDYIARVTPLMGQTPIPVTTEMKRAEDLHQIYSKQINTMLARLEPFYSKEDHGDLQSCTDKGFQFEKETPPEAKHVGDVWKKFVHSLHHPQRSISKHNTLPRAEKQPEGRHAHVSFTTDAFLRLPTEEKKNVFQSLYQKKCQESRQQEVKYSELENLCLEHFHRSLKRKPSLQEEIFLLCQQLYYLPNSPLDEREKAALARRTKAQLRVS